ncbi:MAG: hypothetical protein H0V67_01710 [Geodermatophilaceae bacterium]|nr:hypothetical protein [Geodermatophilaceae bacterium]
MFAGATLGVAVGLSLAATASAAPAAENCSVFWTGAASTTFNVAENWATTAGGGTIPDQLPTAVDVVCMAEVPVRAEILYTSIGRTVAGVDMSARGDVRPRLIVDGGVLRIGSAAGSYDSVIHDLQLLSGSELTGIADYVLSGSPSLSDNAIIDGPGTTTLAPGSQVVTNGLILDNGRRLLNQGSLTHNGCYDYLYLYHGALIENAGLFTAASDCGMRVFSDGTDGSRITNDVGGILEVGQAATDTYVLEAQLDNHGTVSVPSGSLVVRPLASSTGNYDLGVSGRLLIAAGGAMQVGPGTVTGSGTLVLSGGTIDVRAGAVVGAMELLGGTLTGDPTTRSLTGGSASTFTGGGVLTIPAEGTAAVDGLTVEGGSRLLNRGTFSHVGCLEALRLRNGSVLENAGNFVAGTSCDSGIETDGSPGTAVENNAGATFTGAQNASIRLYAIAPPLNNRGTLTVTKGKVVVERTPNLTGGLLSVGTWKATDGTIQLPGPITTNAASITSGAGLFTPAGVNALAQLANNSGTLTVTRTLTIQTTLANTGAVAVTAQTLYVATFTQASGTTTVSSGGALAATVTPDSLFFNGGTVRGAGRLSGAGGNATFDPEGPLLISAAYKPGPQSTLRIALAPTGADVLNVNGGAFLNGTLAISTAPGFTPAIGSTYTILTTSRLSDAFASVSGQDLPGGSYADVAYGDGIIVLTVRGLPRLDVADAAVIVGDAGPTPMEFTVRLSTAVTHPVTVDYRTVEGSAHAGSDFVAKTGTLTFPSGTTSAGVTVTISRDNGYEPVETFTLVLSNAQGAALGDASATGTITHDAAAPTGPDITDVAPATVGLGANDAVISVLGRNFEPTSVITVTGTEVTVVRTTYVDTQTLRVTVDAMGRTTAGLNDVTVTTPGIGADTCSACLRVTAKPLAASASPALGTGAVSRTVTVSGSGFTVGSSATIAGGGITVAASTYVSPTTLRLTVTVPKSAPVSDYDIRVTNPDAGFGACTGCFTVVAGPAISSVSPNAIARGQSTNVTITGSRFVGGATVTPPTGLSVSNVQVVNATTITATMTVPSSRKLAPNLVVSVTNPVSAGSGVGSCPCLSVATLITIGDAAQSVGLSGPAQMQFDVRLDAPTTNTVTVGYRTVEGTASAGSDFIATSGTLTIPANTTSAPLNVSISQDSGAEPVETFTVVLSAPTNAVLSDGTAVGTITHNPGAATLPVVTRLTPSSVGPGAVGYVMTVTGANFRSNSTVAVSGTGLTLVSTTFENSASIRISVTAALSLGASVRDVTVTTPAVGSATCVRCLTVTAKPIPTAASPALAMGATERIVTVTGTGFQSGAQVQLIGNPGAQVLGTSFVSATTLRATVTILNTAVIDQYNVKVINPDAGTGTCAGCFSVTAGPTVDLLTPSAVARGTTTSVTITGTRFVSGAQVLGPEGVTFTTVSVVNSSTITARMAVSATRPTGTNLVITVINPVAGGYGEGTCRCLSITL